MRFIVKIFFLLSQFGFEPMKLVKSLRGLPRYVKDYFQFRSGYSGRLEFLPCLSDWFEEGGSTKDEYFWQDLLVARKIFEANPAKHVDIGSRVDGFVAHVASYREIEVLDIRPITTTIPGVKFKQANLMMPIEEMASYCDSLSCLHALEHFGLGRYGDPIEPDGFERGLVNMIGILAEAGFFYLSVPIGIERVEFNANRVFDPRTIINLALNNSLQLSTLTVIRQGGQVDVLMPDDIELNALASQRYALGIFTFVKLGKNRTASYD